MNLESHKTALLLINDLKTVCECNTIIIGKFGFLLVNEDTIEMLDKFIDVIKSDFTKEADG